MRFLIAILSVVGTSSASVASAQSRPPPTGSSAAFVTGLIATALPVAIGGVMWAQGNSDCHGGAGCTGPDRMTPALLMASGFVIGPSLGYAVAGRGNRAIGRAAIRAGLVLVSFAPAFAICGWDCTQGDSSFDTAWLVVATGAGVGAVSAIYDLVRLRHSGAAPARSAVVVPYYDGRAAGFLMRVSF